MTSDVIVLVVLALAIGVVAGSLVIKINWSKPDVLSVAYAKRQQRIDTIAAMFVTEGVNKQDAVYEAERMLNNQGHQFMENYRKLGDGT